MTRPDATIWGKGGFEIADECLAAHGLLADETSLEVPYLLALG
jgi:hypothetical protein